jgi:hypothetical protein
MEAARFVLEPDRTPFYLSRSIYTNLLRSFDGYKLTNDGDARVKSWTRERSVIIGCRGTSIGKFGGINDLLDDVHLSAGGECALSIVNSASRVIEKYLDFDEIIVCGHSLGGAAAFCLAKKYPQVSRAISFNGAAPLIGGPHLGAGKNCVFYHIVGDIISTHIVGTSCIVYRIKLPGLVDWGDPAYYHSSERFYWEGAYELWTAQQEQDDIADYVYHSTSGSYFVTLLTGIVSKYLHRDRIRELVCQNPIPGSQPSGPCLQDYGVGRAGQVFGTFAGGFLGYLLSGTAAVATVVAASPFALAGVAAAPIAGAWLGYNLSKGEGITDIFRPKFGRKGRFKR